MRFLRDLGSVLRATVTVDRDDDGSEMIYPWQGLANDHSVLEPVPTTSHRVKRFVTWLLPGWPVDPAHQRTRRSQLTTGFALSFFHISSFFVYNVAN